MKLKTLKDIELSTATRYRIKAEADMNTGTLRFIKHFFNLTETEIQNA